MYNLSFSLVMRLGRVEEEEEEEKKIIFHLNELMQAEYPSITFKWQSSTDLPNTFIRGKGKKIANSFFLCLICLRVFRSPIFACRRIKGQYSETTTVITCTPSSPLPLLYFNSSTPHQLSNLVHVVQQPKPLGVANLVSFS